MRKFKESKLTAMAILFRSFSPNRCRIHIHSKKRLNTEQLLVLTTPAGVVQTPEINTGLRKTTFKHNLIFKLYTFNELKNNRVKLRQRYFIIVLCWKSTLRTCDVIFILTATFVTWTTVDILNSSNNSRSAIMASFYTHSCSID